MNAEQKQRAAAEANDTVNTGRDCEHGQLARSCNICDLERELKTVTAQRDKLLEALGLAADMLDMIGQHPQTVANIRHVIAAT